MLRLVLLLLYLAGSLNTPAGDLHGNLDPNGLKPTLDSGGGWDPDGGL